MDDELQVLRNQRLNQLKGEDTKKKEAEEEKKAAENDMKNNILSQILDQKARARLNTLLIAKPDKGQMAENILINMARMGQIGGKLGEQDLISLLERVNEKTQKKTVVKFDRRRAALDSDED